MTERRVLHTALNISMARVKAVGDDLGCLPIEDQTLLLVHGAQGVIDNGGFQYFFEGDWPGQPPYSTFSDAYRRIGAIVVAESLDRGVSLFPFRDPHLEERKRCAFMESLSNESEFFALATVSAATRASGTSSSCT